jgi:large subunit ribosomal protein L19e
MNLRKKKELAAKTLNIGRERIIFVHSRKEEIKEAITKQDIRDLAKEGAIIVKNIAGRRKLQKRKNKRGVGKIKKKVNTRKKEYVIMTRKLRAYLNSVKESLGLSKEEIKEVRNRIKNKRFRSKAILKEYLGGIKKA